jgi:hypothetical protein
MDDETKRALQDLRDCRFDPLGEVALATDPATTTTVISRVCSSNSVVTLTPLDAGAATLGIPRTVPAKGEFVIHHAASVSTRTYRYAVLSPRSR